MKRPYLLCTWLRMRWEGAGCTGTTQSQTRQSNEEPICGEHGISIASGIKDTIVYLNINISSRRPAFSHPSILSLLSLLRIICCQNLQYSFQSLQATFPTYLATRASLMPTQSAHVSPSRAAMSPVVLSPVSKVRLTLRLSIRVESSRCPC